MKQTIQLEGVMDAIALVAEHYIPSKQTLRNRVTKFNGRSSDESIFR